MFRNYFTENPEGSFIPGSSIHVKYPKNILNHPRLDVEACAGDKNSSIVSFQYKNGKYVVFSS